MKTENQIELNRLGLALFLAHKSKGYERKGKVWNCRDAVRRHLADNLRATCGKGNKAYKRAKAKANLVNPMGLFIGGRFYNWS
jgi:hypothetical protein